MGIGIPRVLRACALVGLLMAFTSFLLGVAQWVYPLPNTSPWNWVGRRTTDALTSPSPGKKNLPSSGDITHVVRWELTSLFHHVRESSIWFCAVGVLYLFATQQLRVAKRIAATADE